jgi:hypothetical protein
LEKRVIETLPVVSSVRLHTGDKTHKTVYHTNQRCDCGVKQVGSIHMSSKFPTLRDCLREVGQRIERITDPPAFAAAHIRKLLKKMLLKSPQNVLLMRKLSHSTQMRY